MKIVIDIDDKLYNRIKYLEPKADTMLDKLMRCVKNGTPLPDKHGRLIDADDVNNHIIGFVNLNSCPTIIEAEGSDSD